MLAYAMLAQVAPSRKLAAAFRNAGYKFDWDDFWPWLLLAAVAGCVYAYVLARRKYYDMSLRCDEPQRLFRELCLAHKLDGGSWRLMKHLAAASGFAQPAQVFLTPALFAEKLPEKLLAHAEQYAALKARLF